MNIKFRMPKLSLLLSKHTMVKELMMTFIGTTLSIILTFGTAHYVDQRNAKATGRQTAMMVIHDMDNTTKLLKDMAKEEEKYYKITKYLIENMDEIDSLSEDTMYYIFDYITSSSENDKPFVVDESSEKVFLSSQDSWKNINNAAFIDAVHDFYALRHTHDDIINNSPYFRKPVDSDATYLYFLEHAEDDINYNQIIKLFAEKKDVIYYLENASYRQRYFSQLAEETQRISDRCKFTMGITDEELEEYVENQTRTGRSVMEHELIGKWSFRNSDEAYAALEFLEDHTLKNKGKRFYYNPAYTGHLDISTVSNGTWELQGDSLIICLDHRFEYKIDSTHIKSKPGKEKDFERTIREYNEFYKEKQDERKKEKEKERTAFYATINPSGNKIELKGEVEDEDSDETEIATTYITKEK